VKAGIAVSCLYIVGCGDAQPFEATTWQAASSYGGKGAPTLRQRMVKDVVERVLPGKTKEQIEHLLGPSLDTFYFRSTGRNLIYILGPERDSLFRIDSEWLLIWLDERGRFLRAQLATD
jgi:hypothetical protein